MPTGVYKRTGRHIEICRKAGLASTTKFKKGHKVPKNWRDTISESNNGNIHTDDTKSKISVSMKGENNSQWKYGCDEYHRSNARRIVWGSRKSPDTDNVVHHIDGNITNNNIDNLNVMTRSEHTKLHWRQVNI